MNSPETGRQPVSNQQLGELARAMEKVIPFTETPCAEFGDDTPEYTYKEDMPDATGIIETTLMFFSDINDREDALVANNFYEAISKSYNINGVEVVVNDDGVISKVIKKWSMFVAEDLERDPEEPPYYQEDSGISKDGGQTWLKMRSTL